MQVRRAIAADIDRLVTFTTRQVRETEGAIKGEAVLREGIGRALADESLALYWVLEEDGEVIGSISVLKSWSDWNAGYYWWLQSLFVDESARGKGAMRLLVDTVKQAMDEDGGLEMRIYLNKDNKTALDAYARAGFTRSVYEILVLVDD